MNFLKVQTTTRKKNWIRKVYVIFYDPWCYVPIHNNLSMDRNLELRLDDGQNILKVTAQVLNQERDDNVEAKLKRAKYSEGVAPKERKAGGVNKHLIFDWTVSSDMKLTLILIEKDQASCRHACPFCKDKAL